MSTWIQIVTEKVQAIEAGVFLLFMWNVVLTLAVIILANKKSK